VRMMIEREVILTDKHNQIAKDGNLRKTLSRKGKNNQMTNVLSICDEINTNRYGEEEK